MGKVKPSGLGRAKEDVLERLRQGPQTIAEVARALGVTRNAVRAHVHDLVARGLVQDAGPRPSARRPSRTYSRTPAADALSGRAYVPLADQLLSAAEAAVPLAERQHLLRAAGRGLAGASIGGPLGRRVRVAAGRLEELGAVAKIHRRTGGSFLIEGASCPLTALVRAHPEVCLAVEAFVSQLTRTAAREVCDRTTDFPRCRIDVKA